MKRCLIYEDKNGDCRIIIPGERFQQEHESEQDAIGRLYEMSIPSVTDFIVCDLERIPKENTFRPAWRKGTTEEPIKIDLEHCIKIHRERLKEAAERKIQRLNTEFEIAVENENLPAQVAIRRTKKILRTVHEANLSHCKTPDDVKYAIMPELHDVWTLYPPRR